MKVTTDGCLFGAWCANEIQSKPQKNAVCVLDVGAGTGLLSLMIAQKAAPAIAAVEIDPAAAEQANENVAASPWNERIKVINDDVMNWPPPHRFDFIVSNPPFYANDLRSGTATKNLAHHDEGLTFEQLFLFIETHLKEEGLFFLLCPAKRITEVGKKIAGYGLALHKKIFVEQTPDRPFFRVMIAGGREKKEGEASEDTLTIRGTDGSYTPAFVALLKDYYLYL